MRKIRRRKPIQMSKIIFLFLCILSSISIGYSLLSETLSVSGKGNLVIKDEPSTGKINFNCTKDNWYNNGKFYYNFACTLTNLTEENIVGWEVKISIPDDVEEVTCWNVECSINNSVLTVINMSYNEVLTPNVDTTFGFQLSTTVEDLTLDDVIINGDESNPNPTPSPSPSPTPDPSPSPSPTPTPTESPIPTDDIKVEISLTSSWSTESGGYMNQYAISVINNLDVDTNSWSIKVSFPEEFTLANAWGCNYIAYEDSVLFSNGEWGGIIQAGSSTTFSIQVETQTNDYNPTVIEISYT